MTDERRVVITGLGLVTPLGLGVEQLWDGLINKRSGLRRIEAFDATGLSCCVGGEVPPFKVTDCVPRSYRKSTKVMARDIQIAVAAAYHASHRCRACAPGVSSSEARPAESSTSIPPASEPTSGPV